MRASKDRRPRTAQPHGSCGEESSQRAGAAKPEGAVSAVDSGAQEHQCAPAIAETAPKSKRGAAVAKRKKPFTL